VATGRHSPLSSPSLSLSATPPPTLPTLPTPSSIRQPQTQLNTPSASNTLPPLTSTASSGVSRTASTALLDDHADPPRPRKRPRHHTSSDLEMKFENSASQDIADNADLHESNGSNPNVKNGIVKETTNGVSSSRNGAVRNGARFSDRFFGHSRQEVTRLMIQALNDLGYSFDLPFLS
jgi:hypothetical protein